MRAAFRDLAEHDRREELVVADELGDAGDDAIELVVGGGLGGGNGLHALGGLAEHLAQQRSVQLLFAAEVVIEHRFVDARAAGDAIDPGAGEAAIGELGRGGGEDAVGGDAGGTRHSRESRVARPQSTVDGRVDRN